MKKNNFRKNFWIPACAGMTIVLSLVFTNQAKADEAVTVHLEVETAASTLFNDSISVSACPESSGSATTTVNGFCAFAAAGTAVEASWSSFGAFVTSIGGVPNDEANNNYWLWFLDSEPGPTGINNFLLSDGDKILWTITRMPLKISASTLSPYDGATTTISALQFDPVAFDWIPAANATIDFGWGATTTDLNGQADITATSSTPFSVSASKTNFLLSNSLNITPQAAHANITIRDGATVAFSDSVALPASNSSLVYISPTHASSTVAAPARNLLSVLETLDTAQNEFAITDLQYYSSLNSFFINCIAITAEANPLCGLWQYTLNGVDPAVGADKALLKNGDIVFLYFGTQRQVSLSAAAVTTGTAFTATAQKYDPANNTYVPITDVTIGVTQPNPDDLWNPLEIATSTVDANGQAVFTINAAGTYNAGIKEDYYFPLTTLTITSPVFSAPGSVIIPPSGGNSSQTSSVKVDLAKAIDFLISEQDADGSFGAILQTDWAAMALASANANGSAAQKVKSYLLADPNPLAGMNPVSDYARRALALMSLNISPYDGTKTNYVKKITDLFDGQQFGDTSLYNDDIFALIVLIKSGYAADDEMMRNAINFIISKQQADGSWAGSDLTAAAIQALFPLSSLDGVSVAISKARNFLVNAQGADGGYGNTYTTAWVMQAIAALSESSASWQKNNNTPESYLALSQGADGGLEKNDSYPANRIWSTSYAIPAVQGKPWFNIMNSFSKAGKQAAASANLNAADNPTATSTLEILDMANSTPESRVLGITATSTPVKLTEEIKKAETENIIEKKVETINIAAVEKKAKEPKVLAVKITSPKLVSLIKKEEQKKPEQKITQAQTAPAKKVVDGAADLAEPAASQSADETNILVLTGRLIYRGLRYILSLLGF